MWMALVLPMEILISTYGPSWLKHKKTLWILTVSMSVPALLAVYRHHLHLLAMTTSVNLAVLGTFNTTGFIIVIVCGIDSSVGLLREDVVELLVSRGSTRHYLLLAVTTLN